MKIEESVAAYYAGGSPKAAVDSALKTMGLDWERLTAADLVPFEDLHMGGRAATGDLAAQLALQPGLRVLDVGCGIGGSARFFASNYQVQVDGVDLTADYIRLAEDLTARLGLDQLIRFQQASALRLPFSDASFDRAYMIHVGMNISDKGTVFSEVRRVLKSGGLFGVYDAMRLTPGELMYPMPWAEKEETSFVETVDVYKDALTKSGFAILGERDLWRLGLAGGKPGPIGPNIFLGPTAPQKMAHIFEASQQGVIAPTQIIGRAI